MKIRVFKSIENEVYKVRFTNDVADISEGDKQLMDQFGEPVVNVGGTFGTTTTSTTTTNTSSTTTATTTAPAVNPNEFTLPDNIIRIRSDFPFEIGFDSRDEQFATNTVTKVNSYVTEILARVQAAILAMRARVDTFTSETVTTI